MSEQATAVVEEWDRQDGVLRTSLIRAIDAALREREREALERAAAMVAGKYPTRPEIAEAIRALVGSVDRAEAGDAE
jgi:hypothetical protein